MGRPHLCGSFSLSLSHVPCPCHCPCPCPCSATIPTPPTTPTPTPTRPTTRNTEPETRNPHRPLPTASQRPSVPHQPNPLGERKPHHAGPAQRPAQPSRVPQPTNRRQLAASTPIPTIRISSERHRPSGAAQPSRDGLSISTTRPKGNATLSSLTPR
jgi:hypothetical protein